MDFCCSKMKEQFVHPTCREHGNNCVIYIIRENDGKLRPNHKGKWYLHGTNATYAFKYCPWCGTEIPEDKQVK
jgi:hypothetical protein